MRNREEFKSLVYSKRDKLLAEELEKKKKFNKRRRLYAVLSSAMVAVIVMAVAIPNAGKWMSYHNTPADKAPAPEVGVDGNGGNDAPSEAPVEKENAVASEAPEKDEVVKPSETYAEVADVPETTAAPGAPETSAPEVEEIAPGESCELQVKFTSTISTEPAGNMSVMGSVVGKLDGEIGEEIRIITDYETLKITFEGLCVTTSAASVFGGNEIFSEDRVVFVIERLGGDTGDNEVAYSCTGFEDGTLYLAREYTHNDEYEVLCVEVRCVDFVVVNKYGFDLSQIENIIVTE